MKNYLIIGASSGIGAALSEKLANEGHSVTGTYNSTEPRSTSPNINWIQYNVLDENSDLSFIPENIDGMAYCPGSIDLKPFTRIRSQALIDDYKLNVVGFINVLQNALPALKNNGSGSVVNFSTVAVQNGFPFHAQVSASKGALEGLTKAIGAELSPSIRVNTIAPSLTQTPLAGKLLSSEDKIEANDKRHPLKRIGQPEDIAEMAAFLLSDRSSWISGQIIHVDGGMSTLKV